MSFYTTVSTLACISFLLFGCGTPKEPATDTKKTDVRTDVAATFVGSETCGTCHASEFEHWQTSHHAKAMEIANANSILADLPFTDNQVSIDITAAGHPQVTLNGASSALPITHTFGIEPLQQYLVDTGAGHLQALRHSWDSRPAKEGGQRWFLQYEGEEIPPGDVLHWQEIAQNWNSACADCHTTNFKKGYNPEARSFSSTYSEIGVGCESCHGPGSNHLADSTVHLPAYAALSNPAQQPDICAPCHARREQIAEGYTAGANLLDHYVPQLLNPALYHADGQIDDEVYVYGSFVSSKMFKQGVTCNDCHEPHSANLKVEGDGVCLQCHSPAGNARFETLKLGINYASPEHHKHDPASEAARCTTCHMPSKVYMGVDTRHDHSLRIPNPALSAAHDVPNVCASCHEQTPELWSTPPSHFGNVLVQNSITAEPLLTKLANDEQQNSIVRATALSRLVTPRQAGSVRAFDSASRDVNDLIRHAAASGVAYLSEPKRTAAFKRLLSDPVRAVRSQAAAQALTNLEPAERALLEPDFSAALAEYLAANELNAEHPSANVNLAMAHMRLGDGTEAERYLKRALSINQDFIPALLNYADLMRAQNRDREAEPLLLRAVNLGLNVPEADYAYAMWLVRSGSRELALIYLRRAFESDPETPQWAYTYAVALHSLGQSNSALELLRGLSERPVYQEQLMFLHASIARDVALVDEARIISAQLIKRAPSNNNYRALEESLNP